MDFKNEFKGSNFSEKKIIFPVYQTSNRYRNLYGDVRTWVRELIQNADDAGATSIIIDIKLPNLIEVINNGNCFKAEDVERLLTPTKGGKTLNQTGTLNIGALSVLSVSDTPLYHSGNILLKFEMDHDIEDFIPYLDENYKEVFHGTKILLPLHGRLSEDDLEKLSNIQSYLGDFSHLLFTKSLINIELKYPKKKYVFKKKIEKIKTLGQQNKKNFLKKVIISEKFNAKIITKEWLIAESFLNVPKKYFCKKDYEKINENIGYSINLAFLLNDYAIERIDYPLYIVFPSETQTGLGFVLSSNFRPDTSRKSFSTEGIDGEFNRFLLRKIADLLELTLLYFKDSIHVLSLDKRRAFFKLFLKVLYKEDLITSIDKYINDIINKRILNFLKNNFLDHKGNWVKSYELFSAAPEIWSFLEDSYHFIEPPKEEIVQKLIKKLNIRELTTKDVIQRLSDKILDNNDKILNAWNYLFEHQEDLDSNAVALYLIKWLTQWNHFPKKKVNKKNLLIVLDQVYSYLGNSANFEKLTFNLRKQLLKEAIIYHPETNIFISGTEAIIYSREAEKIFGNHYFYIFTKDYPNSINFFKKIGVITSITTETIADYLLDYVKNDKINTEKLIMLYEILGNRFRYLSKTKKQSLRNSKIILSSDLNTLEAANNIFIPDDRLLIEKFPNIKLTIINTKVLEFFKQLKIRKVSEVIRKTIKISGIIIQNDYSKILTHKIKEIVPYIEIIANDITLILENNWKNRFYGFKSIICEKIDYELYYKGKREIIQANTVEYVPEKKLIVFLKDINIINPNRFNLDLAKALSNVIFIKERGKAKMITPFIEKLLSSTNRAETLKNLGFSTLILEAKGMNLINKELNLPKQEEIFKIPELNQENIQNYYKINDATKNFLKTRKKKLFKSLQFPARLVKVENDFEPAIPNLILKNEKNFNYYIQEDLEIGISIEGLKKFHEIMKYIVSIMDGNKDTVSVAIINTAIHGFYVEGQLLFNYLMLIDDNLREEIPLYFVWLTVAAHELAHNLSTVHDQQHSKYMMLLIIKALKNIEQLKEIYENTFNSN
ncbi:MAG: sacsin N-terminal ATP-binding-like domain-containing protein [Promethearchaeota archaeon]